MRDKATIGHESTEEKAKNKEIWPGREGGWERATTSEGGKLGGEMIVPEKKKSWEGKCHR